ncbi:MAG TPA: Clp protease ClpP [bacterium]|nr:Clp protease ClpP [bacterium]
MNFQKIFKNYSSPRQWFTVNKKADEKTAEIFIYDQIGVDFWTGEGVTPKSFISELRDIEKTHKSLDLRINSPGGFVHDGFTIYNALKQSQLEINVYIDGLAASAAAFIAMAGNKIYMPKSAELMIHNAWGMVIGDAEDMKKEAAHLESLNSMIMDIFSERTGKDKASISSMMNSETWMSGEKAVELGFADELLEESTIAACVFDLDDDILPGLPEGFKNHQNSLKKRIQENALRDAGLSRSAAKKKLAENQRDADEMNSIEIQKSANELITKELQKCQTQFL